MGTALIPPITTEGRGHHGRGVLKGVDPFLVLQVVQVVWDGLRNKEG